jgi:hypothetical protein
VENLNEFTKELEMLCQKYGYIITGKTTSNLIHIDKCVESSCKIKSKFEESAYILCRCKDAY